MASIFGKSELSGVWKERFNDVNKLNEYTKQGLKIEISDALIKDYKFNDAIFNNASFKEVEWIDTVTKKLSFTNTVFKSNSFENVEFTDAIFTNVTFEDSEFYNTSFYLSQMTGVKFVRCTFKNKSDFSTIKNANIEFDHSTFDHTSFAETQGNLFFRNSTLNNVRLIDLVFPSSITFENSKLQDVALDRSKLTKLEMDNVTGDGRNGFNGGSIADVEVRNSTIRFGLNEGDVGKVSFINSTISAGFRSSKIKEFIIVNCKEVKGLGFYKASLDNLQISNCPIGNIDMTFAIINHASFEKLSIEKSSFRTTKMMSLSFTDVSLDGSMDFSNAQVEHILTQNVTKLPGLNLNLTGSNVKF